MSVHKYSVAIDDEEWVPILDQAIAAQHDRMIEVRRRMHADPEPSGSEHSTTQFILSQLHDDLLDVRLGPDGRGAIVDNLSGGAGPRIGIRADIDALPIQDEKHVEYSSRVPGVMHACGHDGHAACIMGAIGALCHMERTDALPWPVAWRALFQPAEETNMGAKAMVAHGALENVSALFALHMDPSRLVGDIGVCDGPFTADCVELRFEIHGRGGHGARPHESRDPITVAAQLISSIHLFVPRVNSPQDPVIVSFGMVHGGDAPNAIPSHVTLRGTMRCFHPDTRRRTLGHIRRLAEGLAASSETRIELETIEGPPAVLNDRALTKILRETGTSLLGADHVQEIRIPSMGGEDFANYLDHLRGAMFRLGCASAPDAPPLHSPQFDFDERALPIGASILAAALIRASTPAEHTE